ncbi:MAG: TatD family hydrolase [Acidimicrobiia bacterium]|nr:TatD family hydrolase [Acidimicrobiia bacterium]
MWFDNHCHLTTMKTDPADAVADAAAAGVDRLLTVGCTVDDSARAADLASGFASVWATAGVHPHDASGGVEGLAELLDRPAVVAVGESGLDYHYDRSPRPIQADVFRYQIGLANERDLALVIHTREAWDDTFAILDAEGVPARTVFHCFTGGPDEADACLERGASLSFSGIVTFGSAGDLRAAAERTPLDRLMVETDSPFLAPVPLRGKPNRPANVAIVGEFLAELRGDPSDHVAAATTANAVALYQL